MKHFFALILILAVGLAGVNSCGTEATGTKAESGSTMLNLLPRDATGVFYVDVQRVMSSPLGAKAMDEKDHDLEDFTRETGINLRTDVFGMVGVVDGESKDDAEGVVVFNMNYDRGAVMKKIKEEHPALKFETYEGVEFADLPSKPGEEPTQVAFLDDSHIAFGSPAHVHRVIDVSKKGADSVEQNADLMAAMKGIDKGAMMWGAFAIPASAAEELAGNPMLGGLSGLRSLVMSIDYKNDALLGEIVGNTGSEDASRQIAEMLTGLKAMAAMWTAEKPNMAEVLNTIKITSNASEVRLSTNIPEKLLMSLETGE